MNASFLKKTRLALVAVFGTALLSSAAPAGAVDPSTLVSKAEATALIGQPVVATSGGPAEKDDDSGGMLSYCTFRAGPSALIVSVVSFSSATEAKAKTTRQLAAARLDGDDAKIVEESGLGDRAFWATTANGAEYVVLKGSRVLGLALGGKPAKPPASYRDALRALAKSALEKL
jgi:hypothetical protein